jgi:hypothetical protein
MYLLKCSIIFMGSGSGDVFWGSVCFPFFLVIPDSSSHVDSFSPSGNYENPEYSTVKPLFIVFDRGLKKKQWIRENNRCGSHS